MSGSERDSVLLAEGGDGNPRAAFGVLVVSLSLGAIAVVLFALSEPEWSSDQWFFAVDLVDATLYGIVAWLLLARRAHPVAWILAATAIGGGLAAIGYEWHQLVALHPDWPELASLQSMQSRAWIPGTMALFTVVPWLVRNDPLDRRARWGVAAGSLATSWIVMVRLVDPATPWTDSKLLWGIRVVEVVAFCAALDAVHRWRTRSPEQRRGLGWLALGTLPMCLASLPLALPQSIGEDLPIAFTPLLHLTAQLFFPAAILGAVLRGRLWGVDLAVSRTLVWSLLTAGVVVTYLVVVAALTPLFSRDGAPEMLATALVAAGFQPGRSWLQKRVTKLVHGESGDPLSAMRRVSRYLGRARGPEGLLGVVLESLTTSMRLSSGMIEVYKPDCPLGGTDILAQVGTVVGEEVTIPLLNHRGAVGRLVVTARTGERLDGRALASLEELAPIVAATLELALTTQALATSRRRLAEARDEERRGLRRELHDGLGPALAGVNLGLQAARNQLNVSPPKAAALLERMSAELDQRVEEVRGLARGLLPPTLGELGLSPALDEVAERYAVTGLRVEVSIGGDAIADLTPDVTTAVYAIVSEAIRNVHRHADADKCNVDVEMNGDLVVTVVDNGAGISENAYPGVGMTSMKERTEGLGGTFSVSTERPGGTKVEVVVPGFLAVEGP